MTAAHYRPWEPLLPATWAVKGTALVVAPHPDDEILGCGGVVAAHRDQGVEVHVAVMTDGGLGNPGGDGGPEYVALRKEETLRALDLLGGAEHHFLDYPDGSLKDNWGPVGDLVSLIDRVRPTTLLLPSPYEVHPDHRATSLIAFRAVRAAAEKPELLCYEVGAMMPANLLLDITPQMLKKEAAVRAFPSQLLHHDLVTKVRALNHARTVNVDDAAIRYAEAYLRVDPARADGFLDIVEQLLRLTDDMGPSL